MKRVGGAIDTGDTVVTRDEISVSVDKQKQPLVPFPSWLPGMDDIRAAHNAQADALESVVATLASKQHASITALRRQMEDMVAASAQGTGGSTKRGNSDRHLKDGRTDAHCDQRAPRGGGRGARGAGDASNAVTIENDSVSDPVLVETGMIGEPDGSRSDAAVHHRVLQQREGQFVCSSCVGCMNNQAAKIGAGVENDTVRSPFAIHLLLV